MKFNQHPWLSRVGILYLTLSQLVAVSGASPAAMEYFMGTDPGEGNGTPLTLGADTDVSAALQSATLAADLAPGTHTVAVRVQDSEGRWSTPALRRFTVYPQSGANLPAPAGGKSPALVEYFMGTDPGEGNGTPLTLGADTGVSAALQSATLAADLAPGTHTVAVRVQDSDGRWSTPALRRFTVYPLPGAVSSEPFVEAPRIASYTLRLAQTFSCNQAFFISVAGTRIEFAARPFETEVQFLDRLTTAINQHPRLRGLVLAERRDAGFIFLSARDIGPKNSEWLSTSQNLEVVDESSGTFGSLARKIIDAEYFINNLGPEGSGIPFVHTIASSGYAATFDSIQIPAGSLREGTHSVYIRLQNAAGGWGNAFIRRFSVLSLGDADATPPAITLTDGSTISWPVDQVPFSDPGAFAVDDIDGDLSGQLQVTGFVDPTVPGTYSLEYSVSDTAGNLATAIRTVEVVYHGTPEFSGPTSIAYDTPPATIDLFNDLQATDPRFGDLSHAIRLTNYAIDWFNAGSYQIEFTVADPAGNTNAFTRTITLAPNAVFYPDYESWIQGIAQSAGASGDALLPGANPDGDSATNYQEWLADTHPFDYYSCLALDHERNGLNDTILFSGQHRIRYQVEVSADLVHWNPIGDPITFDSGCLMLLERPLADTAIKQFYRIQFGPRQPVFNP